MFKSGISLICLCKSNHYSLIYRGDDGRRFVLQQPLLYSETAYNYRRLGELWYQLMHSGNPSSIDLLRLMIYFLAFR